MHEVKSQNSLRFIPIDIAGKTSGEKLDIAAQKMELENTDVFIVSKLGRNSLSYKPARKRYPF